MPDISTLLPALILGAFAAFAVDIWWWTRIADAQKIEGKSRLLKIHEHYHVGLELILLGFLLPWVVPDSSTSFAILAAALFAIGCGFGFIMAEWRQVHEIKQMQVVPGHPFAYGSGHFKSSTAIGVVLVGLLAALMAIRFI